MTGAYLRVQRDGRWVNVEIEHCTPEERRVALDGRSVGELHMWLDMACAVLARLEHKGDDRW